MSDTPGPDEQDAAPGPRPPGVSRPSPGPFVPPAPGPFVPPAPGPFVPPAPGPFVPPAPAELGPPFGSPPPAGPAVPPPWTPPGATPYPGGRPAGDGPPHAGPLQSGPGVPPAWAPLGYGPGLAVPRQDGSAVASLVLGILAIVLSVMCCLGAIPGAIGLPLGIAAQRRIGRSGGALSGGGLAVAGIVCNSIGIAISMLVLVLGTALAFAP